MESEGVIVADLPKIWAQPNLQAVPLPRTNPNAFGANFFEASANALDALAKQKQAQDLVDAQNALDMRDEVYQRRRLEMKQNPGDVANMTADHFIKSWNDTAAKDDQEILSTLPNAVRRHADILFSRLKRKEFDQHFNDYHGIWLDTQRGAMISSRDDTVEKIALGTPSERLYYSDQLNAMMSAAQHSGIFKAEEIANMRRDVNSDVEAVQANTIMLNKTAGGPQEVLAKIHGGLWPNLKPSVREGLIANATRMAKMNENEAVKIQTQKQDGLFRVMSRLAEGGKLSMDEIKSAEETNGIRPEQARHLYGIQGNPTFANAPGAVNGIMGERARAGEISLAANQKAREQLMKLDPADKSVVAALNLLNSSDRMLKGGNGLHVTQGVREFKDSIYSGNKTVLQHFTLPGLDYQKGQIFNNAINHLEVQLGQGVPKEKAIKEALDMVRPKTGAAQSSDENVQQYSGE